MPDRLRFDLRQERWIPCEKPDGSRELVGIERALTEAHTFAALHDESPLVTASLHRLLLAVLQRVFAPRSMDDWAALYEARAFDAGKIREYLDQWGERFDLFHPERPFLQVRGLAKVHEAACGVEAKPKSASRLPIQTSPYSKNDTALLSAVPSDSSLTADAAARALVTYLSYTQSGTVDNEPESDHKRAPEGPLRGAGVILIRGSTLADTLLFNLIYIPRRQPDDVPPWERSSPTDRCRRASQGHVDSLVWPSRRIELLAAQDQEHQFHVRDAIVTAGERLAGEPSDGMFAYIVRDPKKGPLAIRLEAGRALFRDSAALFVSGASSEYVYKQPAALTQLAELIREGVVHPATRFQADVFGLARGDKATKIDLWRAERMPVPGSLLTDGTRLATLFAALQLTETLAAKLDFPVLDTLAKNALAPGGRDPKGDIANLKTALGGMAGYWAALGAEFPAWLDALGTADPDAHLAPWKTILRDTARSLLDDAERRLGTSARALQAGAKARGALTSVLYGVLGPSALRSSPDSTSTAAEGAPA